MITVQTEYTPTGAALQKCSFDNRTFAACFYEIAQAMDLEPELTGGRVEFYGSEDELVALTHAAETDFHARMEPDAAPVVPVAVVPVKPAKVRCRHYASIKTFFAVARDAGLDTSAASRDRVRGALGVFVGRRLASRNEVTGAEWQGAAQAIKTGRLFW
jgi:hypothetical protein